MIYEICIDSSLMHFFERMLHDEILKQSIGNILSVLINGDSFNESVFTLSKNYLLINIDETVKIKKLCSKIFRMLSVYWNLELIQFLTENLELNYLLLDFLELENSSMIQNILNGNSDIFYSLADNNNHPQNLLDCIIEYIVINEIVQFLLNINCQGFLRCNDSIMRFLIVMNNFLQIDFED